jgi:hypothetical protein
VSELTDLAEATPAPRRSRRLPRLIGTAGLVVGVGVVSSLTTVWATHDFPDVPTSSPHHADISWAVDNGITQGYGDGTFKPTQAVSRQTMATFLRRLNAATYVTSEESTGTSSTAGYTASANCAPGERAIAGGGQSDAQDTFITDSYPSADSWYVRFEEENDGNVLGAEFTVWVLCAPGL